MTKSSWSFVGATVGALVLALALSVMSGDLVVHAVPQPPHVFFGRVFVDGAQTGGQTIKAGIGGINYANSEQTGRNTTVASNGTYGSLQNFHVCADSDDTTAKEGGKDGEPIDFLINSWKAVARLPGSSVVVDPVLFQPAEATELDLYIYTASTTASLSEATGVACTSGDEVTPTPAPSVDQPPAVHSAIASAQVPGAFFPQAEDVPTAPAPVTTSTLAGGASGGGVLADLAQADPGQAAAVILQTLEDTENLTSTVAAILAAADVSTEALAALGAVLAEVADTSVGDAGSIFVELAGQNAADAAAIILAVQGVDSQATQNAFANAAQTAEATGVTEALGNAFAAAAGLDAEGAGDILRGSAEQSLAAVAAVFTEAAGVAAQAVGASLAAVGVGAVDTAADILVVSAGIDTTAAGGALAGSATANDQSTGQFMVVAAAASVADIGGAIGIAAGTAATDMGGAFAVSAVINSDTMGVVLTVAVVEVSVNAAGISNMLITSAGTEAGATTDSMNAGPAQDPQALAILGQFIDPNVFTF